MNTPRQTRVFLLILASATALPAQVDAVEIVRRAVAADQRNWAAARNYVFSERVDARRLDPEGRLKSRDVKIYDVMLLDGSPYRRLAGRNDRPLPPADEKKEQEKLAKSTVERRKESGVERALRLAEYAGRPEWQREAWRDLPEAFDFRLAAEEARDGRRLYVIHASPRQGYEPKSRTAKVLVRLQGKLWVDKQDYQLMKAEVEAIDTISLGLFLVRLAKGSRATFEQTRVNDEVWLPRQVRALATIRMGLVKVLHIKQEISYSKRREFQADSRIIARVEAR